MKKALLSLLFLSFLCISTEHGTSGNNHISAEPPHEQQPYYVTFEEVFGDSGCERIASIRQSDDGGYIVVGSTRECMSDTADVYLMKFDPFGCPHWTRTYGGDLWDRGYSVDQTTDGGFVLVGKTWSFGAGMSDIYVVKTNAEGEEEWSNTFGGASGDWGRSIRQTKDGGYIIAGYNGDEGSACLLKLDSTGSEEWFYSYSNVWSTAESVQQTSDRGFILTGDIDSQSGGLYLLKTDSLGIEEWSRIYDKQSDDECEFCYSGNSVRQTPEGGYIIAGSYEIFCGLKEECEAKNSVPPPVDNNNIYVLKTDALGYEEWSRIISGMGDETASCVDVTGDGAYIITGSTHMFYEWGPTTMFLMKMNSTGYEEWIRYWKGITDESFDTGGAYVECTRDGGFIAGGTFSTPDSKGSESKGGRRRGIYLVKTDPEGYVRGWSRTIAGDGDDHAYSMIPTNDRGFILVGESYSFDLGSRDIYVVKLDSTAEIEWDRTYGSLDDCSGYSIIQAPDGGYVIAGDVVKLGHEDHDVFLLKITDSGEEKWSKIFGGDQNDSGRSVDLTDDGGFIIAGETFSYGQGEEDVYLIKVDEFGKEQWSSTVGGSDSEGGNSVKQTHDGGFIIVGKKNSISDGGMYLVKVDRTGTEEWHRVYWDVGSQGYCVQEAPDGGYICTGEDDEDYSFILKTDPLGRKDWEYYGALGIIRSIEQTDDNGYIAVGGTEWLGAGVLLTRLDHQGNLGWERILGGGYGVSVQYDHEGGFLIAGNISSGGQEDILLIKTDEEGGI